MISFTFSEVVSSDETPGEEGTYYVDQAGQYYYQSPACEGGQQVMTVVSGGFSSYI